MSARFRPRVCARASRVFHVAARGDAAVTHSCRRTHSRTHALSSSPCRGSRIALGRLSNHSRVSSIPEHPPFTHVRRGGKHSSLTARQWGEGGERILRNPGMTEPDGKRALPLSIVRLTLDCTRVCVCMCVQQTRVCTGTRTCTYTAQRETPRRSLANEPRRFLNSKEPGHLRGPDLPPFPSRPSVPAS